MLPGNNLQDNGFMKPETPAEHQQARLAALPAIYKTAHERMAVELAMGMDEPVDVFERYGYTADQGIALMDTPAFAATLERISKEVQSNGLTFRAKARVQAEALLEHSFEIATDPDAPAAVRADLIKWTAKVGDLEPRKEADESKAGGGFSLSITFSGQEPMKVVAHEPVLIEGARQ